MNNKKYQETIALCTGAQKNTNVKNWNTLSEFDNTSKNKDFDAKVYKQGNRVIIVFAGTNIYRQNDLRNDNAIMNGKIPAQYGDAERLYNLVKSKYGNCNIEFMGYSLGATISNLMSHRTGLPSHAIAPIGSKHIADSNKDYFKFDDSKIVTYGKMADGFFRYPLINKKQSGTIILLPDLKTNQKGYLDKNIENHYLHNYMPEQFSKSKVFDINRLSEKLIQSIKNEYGLIENIIKFLDLENIPSKKIDVSSFFGWKNPISGDSKIYTKEYINQMTPDELKKHQKEIEIQAKKIGIPENKDMKEAQSRHGSVVHVKAYTRASGVHVRDYYRSI